ncbi:MAG: NAD(P)-dependent oxidoreductase [Burkholderiales bacterium]
MKILVTGSSGRIGSAICERLRREHEVTGLDRSASATTAIVGDIGDATVLERALRGIDAVVHSAALHAPHVGAVDDREFERVNVHATRLLADLATAAGVRRLVFTSTTALYGAASAANESAVWVDEALAPHPQTIYHRTKLAAEAVLAAHPTLAVTALRMSRCFPEPVPLMAVYRLHRGVDARDVAEAHALALASVQPGFRRYVISGATPFERGDLGELMHDAPSVLRRRAPALVEAFERRGWPLPRSIDRVYCPALAMRELGWAPRYGAEELLTRARTASSR